jgi:type IV pilus assembly protein PilY1
MLPAIRIIAIVATATFAGWHSGPAHATLDLAQAPLFQQTPTPPLNMLVMDRDHKLFYEAYNDASDLNGDGITDIGYKPNEIDYFGYFDSYTCYDYNSGSGRFVPAVRNGPGNGSVPDRTRKRCSGRWSGDFLNYLTTTRIDALRKVLYGGRRVVDTAAAAGTPAVTVLERAYVPQDGHSFGKEYTSTAVDGYDIANYAPDLGQPGTGRRHLFANLALSRGGDPLLRVIENSSFRIWNWISIERPVGGDECFNASNNRVACVSGGTTEPWPGHPNDRGQLDAQQAALAIPANATGSDNPATIRCNEADQCNLGTPAPSQDEYMTIITGRLVISVAGTYQFSVDGDDAVEFVLTDSNGAELAARGWYGGHGNCNACDTYTTAEVSLVAGTYGVRFRHTEGTGGDNYRVRWRKTVGVGTFGWQDLPSLVSASNANGGLNGLTRTTYDTTPAIAGGSPERRDYVVRVEVCKDATLAEDNCREYGPVAGPTALKPTGILHQYGETGEMMFGLISGTWDNNHQGGVLRRRMAPLLGRDLNGDGDFVDTGESAPEININTGQFVSTTRGIIHNLDRFSIGGFRYPPDSSHDYSAVGCPALGDRSPANGECPDWGNPIGEMMWESLRYFAGAGAPVAAFSTSSAGAGTTIESNLGLTEETAANGGWLDPYRALQDGGFAYCAKPFQTVISDINPSFDSNLPGNAFAAAVPTATNPASIGSLDVAAQAQTIWEQEGLGTTNVFFGEVGSANNGAPTAKSASSFGNIRGMAEEPTKQGTYYAASLARFGFLNDINAARSSQNLRTYAVALASPRPRMEFPIGSGGKVTLVPFAKTVAGCFNATPGASFQASNTLVDFYVERYVNIRTANEDPSINLGRPSAIFRINWEDVEQGNDHDMDAIVRYQLEQNADGTVSVNLTSEYAAGSCVQYMGYTISGTTADGIYLDVRDRDTADANAVAYRFATPPGLSAGACGVTTPPAQCTTTPVLTLNNSRIFTPNPAAGSARPVRDPLFYAAKYGGFTDRNNNGRPDDTEWDALPPGLDANNDGDFTDPGDRLPGDGVPDNYFLVTNALFLRQQLEAAFDRIRDSNLESGGVTVSGVRLDAGSVSYVPEFTNQSWVGDLKAYEILSNGDAGAIKWSANERLPADLSSRRIYTALTSGYSNTPSQVQTAEFTVAGLGGATQVPAAIGLLSTDLATRYGGATPAQVIAYLRGDSTLEVASGGRFRNRRDASGNSILIGDIVGSQPALMRAADDYGYARVDALSDTAQSAYATFLTSKASRVPAVFVGSNSGKFHAFNASGDIAVGGGTELFAYIPSTARVQMGRLLDPNYIHRYLTDGSPQVGDVWDGSSWRSIVTASVGAGGRAVFALDVTNPSAFDGSKVLWEVTSAQDGDIGTAISRPAVVPLEDGNFYVVFGNGYNSDSQDAVLFAANATTGRVGASRKLVLADGSNTAPNGLGPVTVIDTNGNELGDTIYAGDYQGNLWKVTVSSSGDMSAAFGTTPLFVASDAATPTPRRQNITGGITVTRGAVSGTYVVLFGTGRYLLVGDNASVPSPQVQTLYGLIDRGSAITTGRTGLVRQRIDRVTYRDSSSPPDGVVDVAVSRDVSNLAVDVNTANGWYLDLQDPAGPIPQLGGARGERFFGRPRVVGGNVLFSTFTPQGGECSPGGLSQLLCLRTLTGGGGNCLGNTDGLTLLVGPPVPEPPVVQPPQCDTLDCAPPRPQPPDGAGNPNFCDDPVNDAGLYCQCRDNSSVSPQCPCLLNPADPACEVPNINAGVLPGLCPVYVLTPAGPALTLLRPCGRQAWREIR